jgi:hypothetical protein
MTVDKRESYYKGLKGRDKKKKKKKKEVNNKEKIK